MMTWCRNVSIRTMMGTAMIIVVVTTHGIGDLNREVFRKKVNVVGMACVVLADASETVNRKLP